MKKKSLVLVVLCAIVSAVPERARTDEPNGPLEGTWSVVAVTMNGVKATDRIAGGLRLTVRGNKISLKPGLAVDGNGKVEVGDSEGDDAAFKLDPTKSPAHIDLTLGSGRNRRIVKGIYVVEKAELKICFSPQARPKDFANVADSGQTLLVAQRDQL
jgi:uncharacterized protein (TIGR03067 family)